LDTEDKLKLIRGYKYIAFGSLAFIFIAYIILNYFNNQRLIEARLDIAVDYSFTFIMAAIFCSTATIFRLLEKLTTN
jgi:hypothetical protein